MATVVSIVVTAPATPAPAAATPLAECDSGCAPLLPPVPILCRILVVGAGAVTAVARRRPR